MADPATGLAGESKWCSPGREERLNCALRAFVERRAETAKYLIKGFAKVNLEYGSFFIKGIRQPNFLRRV